MNTVSESSLKFNLIGNRSVTEKYQNQSERKSLLKVDRRKVVQPEPQKSQTVKTQLSQPVEHQFECLHCSKVFELKSQLEMHEIGHKQFERCSDSLSRQEVITVKEEVLSDDEVVENGASANEYYNIEGTSLPVNVQCLEIENPNSVSLGSDTSKNGLNSIDVCANSTLKNYDGICNAVDSALGSDSKLVKLCLVSNKDGTRKHEKHTTNLGSVNMNVKNVMRQQQFKMKPKIARCYGTSVEHQFKCQECGETFELKSYLVNHEISHDHYRKYKPPPTVAYVKRSRTTNHAGSVNVNVKKVMQQQHERKTRSAPSSFAMCYLMNQSYRTNYLSSVKVNKKKVQRRPKTKPMVEPTCDTSSEGHQFKCQECGETFELKSCLVMHEISHEHCRRHSSLPALEHTKRARATYCVVGSVTVSAKKAMQQQLDMKPTTETSYETPSVEHRFQEYSQTSKPKSHLLIREAAHGRYIKWSK
jgi:5-methylcytosine-specific restriction endonuclease McrA